MKKPEDSRYGFITPGMFEEKLQEKLEEASGAELLSIPGVFEAASEHYNNEILDELVEEHDDGTDDEEDED